MTFTKLVLYTDRDGRAKWREEALALSEGTPQAMLSKLFPSAGYQLRHSPAGFRSQWHCTPHPQWVFILEGEMEIGLREGAARVFRPGEHFFSADTLPEGATFDAECTGTGARSAARERSSPFSCGPRRGLRLVPAKAGTQFRKLESLIRKVFPLGIHLLDQPDLPRDFTSRVFPLFERVHTRLNWVPAFAGTTI